MKKLAFVGAVLLVVVGLGTSPAWAEAGSPQDVPMLSAEDQAFLATLAALEVTPAPELADKNPGIVTKSSCTAMASCGGGIALNCNGNTSCTGVDRNCAIGQRGYVTCDGVTTWCPTTCADYCNSLFAQCENGCPNNCVKSFRCTPYSCVCGSPCI